MHYDISRHLFNGTTIKELLDLSWSSYYHIRSTEKKQPKDPEEKNIGEGNS